MKYDVRCMKYDVIRCGKKEKAESIINGTCESEFSASESRKGRMADAWALTGDEGRDKLR